MNLDLQSITNEIVYFGTSVTLKVVTDSSYSDHGDATESTSNTTKSAFVQILSQTYDLVKEGVFQAGDKIFWFKGNETNISRGNRIHHSSLWYEITNVIPHEIGGTTYIIEAHVKKI